MSERYRWPWYWLVILVAVAIAGTVAISLSSRSRLHAIDENFASAQMLRLQRIEQRIDDYFAKANQLIEIEARMAQGSVGDERMVRWFTAQAFASRVDPKVYGLGVFFAPYAFDGRNRLVNFYDHVRVSGIATSSASHRHGDLDEVVFKAYGVGEDDYTRQMFFQNALRMRGATTYAGPYLDHGVSFISVVKAFYRGGSLSGVASVDTLLDEFKAMLGKSVVPGDVAWIDVPGQGMLVSIADVPVSGSAFADAWVPLRYSHARVHLTSDRSSLGRAKRETVTAAVVAIVALWALALLTGIVLVQRWRSIQETRTLELQQEYLEAEIVVARRVEAELRKAAFTDELTGLPNRAAFMDALSGLLARPRRDAQAVFLIDLDHFNITNETLGHPAGDELLRIVSARLSAGLGGDAFVARLGGDEFVVLSACATADVDSLSSLLMRAIAEPVVLYGRTIYPKSSIGVTLVDSSYREPQDVLRDADIAMYAAKDRGRARHAVFDREMREQVSRDAELELHLRRAIERGEIVPYYQPIVDLLTRKTVSFEALARWHRDGETVSASSFVAFAEGRGFVHEIDAAMLHATLGQANAVFALFPNATIALNVAAPELATPDYAAALMDLLAKNGVPPQRIRLEITETTMMTRADEARETLRRLGEHGITVVLDDFGTGYSSLAYLQRLSIAGLKIDRSFVERIDDDERSREIVRSIVALAHALGLTTIAEGVERAAQVHELALLGVKYGQGFFFSRAVPVSALSDMHIPDEAPAVANLGE